MDAIWTATWPAGHGENLARNINPTCKYYGGDTIETARQKRIKLAGLKHKNPDFINQSPLMQVTTPVPANSTLMTTLFGRFQRPTQFPRLASPTGTGTSQTICLNSAFMSPNNCCVTNRCGDRKNRTQRLHIDLSREPWRSQPETYWYPLVQFLQNDAVYQHIRPTEALKRDTPSAKWH